MLVWNLENVSKEQLLLSKTAFLNTLLCIAPFALGCHMSDLYFLNALMLINVEFEVLTLLNPAKMCDIDSTESRKS